MTAPCTPGGPYARAREAFRVPMEEMQSELAEMPPGEMRRLVSMLRRTAKRIRWRGLQQLRCTRLAAALAVSERAIGERYSGRRKQPDKSWVLFAEYGAGSLPAIRVALMPVRAFDSFESPIRVQVLAPHLVQWDVLEQRVRRINGEAAGEHRERP